MKLFSLQTFFIPFVNFFAHDSTLPRRRRTTTKLLLGTLSIARGQKVIVLKWQDLPDFGFELKIF